MKTIVITGATSGFGFGLTKAFLECGYQVLATGRNLRKRTEIFEELRKIYANQLEEFDLDIANKVDLQNFISALGERDVDVLINNAGMGVFGPLEGCSEESLREQFEINFFGLVFLTQALLPKLRKSKGHIINFSSVFGFVGFPLTSAYCSSKFAVEGFSESLSHELRPHGVKVTLIEPGGYPTKFNNNIKWGTENIEKDSVYYRQVENYHRLRKDFSARPKPQSPQEVIDGVVNIIVNRKAGLNYTFGQDATLTSIFSKLLPRKLFHHLMGKFLDREFLR